LQLSLWAPFFGSIGIFSHNRARRNLGRKCAQPSPYRGSGENLHLEERFTRFDTDTLLDEFTVDNLLSAARAEEKKERENKSK
jgi:hypothetical protein